MFRPWTLHNMWLFSQRGRLLPGSEPAGGDGMDTALSTIAGWRPVHQSSDIFGYGATCPHAFTMARIVWRGVVFCTHATHASADGRSSVCDMSCVLHTTTTPDDTFAPDLPPCIVVSVLGALKGNLSWLASLRYVAI